MLPTVEMEQAQLKWDASYNGLHFVGGRTLPRSSGVANPRDRLKCLSSSYGDVCLTIHVPISSSATGEIVSSIWPYSAMLPVEQV